VLRFFSINDPYRLVGAFFLLVIFRIPFWISGPDLMIPELQWMLIGERMSRGFVMYYEIWDYTSPLSATVYWFIDMIFGRSVIAYHILALIFAFIQVYLFNFIAYKNKFFPVNGYIPALVYAVLISFSMDFLTLSPILMGTTFVLLALNNIISQIEFRAKRDEKLLSIGLYLGIAGLFHFPLIVLGPIMVVVLLLFSSTIPRRFFMILYGWMVPFIFTGIYYFFTDSLYFFWLNQVSAWFRIPHFNVVPVSQVLLIIAPIMVFILFSVIRIMKKARLTNYQSRLIQVMFSSIALSTVILFMEIDRYLFVFIAFIPWVAYFVSFYFILAKRKWFAEFMFLVLLMSVVGVNWYTVLDKDQTLIDFSGYYLPELHEPVKPEKLALMDNGIQTYVTNTPATPFLNWRLSVIDWENLNRYPFLSLSVKSILKEKPEKIIDPNGYFKELLDRAPFLRDMYQLEEVNVYRLNN
jgi:hypothetical protein